MQNKIKLGRAYRHKRTGNEVITQELATLRFNDIKYQVVVYSDSRCDRHVRTIGDFLNKCELIK